MKKLAFILLVMFSLNINAQKTVKDSFIFLTEPKIKFKNWDKPFLLTKDFIKSTELIAQCDDSIECRVISYVMSATFNGWTQDIKIKSNKFSEKAIELFLRVPNETKIYFEEIYVQYSNGIIRKASPFGIRKIDDEFNEFVKQGLKDNFLNDDFGIFKSDIRIKIIGNPTYNEEKIVHELVNDLKPLIENVNIKVVNYAPNIILDFQHYPKHQNSYGSTKQLKDIAINPFFPKLITKYFVFENIDSNYNSTKYIIYSSIIRKLARFNFNNYINWTKTIIAGENDNISNFDSRLIKMLYSNTGKSELKKILKIQDVDYSDNTLLIVILSFLFFIVFSELNSKFNFLFVFQKIPNKFIRRILISLLIVQIPVLILIIYNYLKEGLTFSEIVKIELFFCIYSLIIASFLAIIDIINNKIKTLGFILLLDIILIPLSFLIGYQLVFLIERPEIMKSDLLEVQWLYIPLSIVCYRFYIKYSQKRLLGIIKEKELEISKQKEIVLKSELLSMQSRINPHFLYNALNSIASLIYISANKTEEMTLSLAKLFRYNINKSGEIFSTIAKEIEMVKIYLDVEMVRFSDRMQYSVEVSKDIEDKIIPSFLLQPLVENAIKHGISKLTGQGIVKLKVFKENNYLNILVYDNGPDFPTDIRANYGLQSIFDKLKIFYNEDFSIQFLNSPEKKVVIKIKI